MDFSQVVQWWDEWQLRVLVIGSLLVQCILFSSSAVRKFHIPGWFRFFIWLAYLGGDALAIYALATLFNRQKPPSVHSSSHGLEVMWAPVLLIHLGGQDPITAYNIEDNELWTRHLITVVSQVTVAVYVFCKSWSGENRLLQAAILLFVAGFLKGSEKPWALNRASIHSLVSSSSKSHSRLASIFLSNNGEEQYQSFIKKVAAERVARIFGRVQFMANLAQRVASHCEKVLQGGGQGEDNQRQGGSRSDLTLQTYVKEAKGYVENATVDHDDPEKALQKALPYLPLEPRELFVDLALPYSRRLRILQSLLPLDGTRVDRVLQAGLSNTFDLLYTKENVFQTDCGRFVRIGIVIMTFAAVGLFSRSHKHSYNDKDVIVTYILFSGTAALETFAVLRGMILDNSDVPRSHRVLENPQRNSFSPKIEQWLQRRLFHPVQEARWKLINKSMELFHPVREACWKRVNNGSSEVRQLLKQMFLLEQFDDWLRKPRWYGTVAQYNLIDFFARNASPNVLMKAARFFGCKGYLDRHWYVEYCSSSGGITELILEHVKDGWKEHIDGVASYKEFNSRRGQRTLQRVEFDESVLLWHIATDLCFRIQNTPDQEPPIIRRRCREMSNYMIYLLFVQPEMLLAGTRQNLFTTACSELNEVFKDGKPQMDGRELAREVAEKAQDAKGTFIHDAWKVYEALLKLGDEKIWEVIQSVWVEMLCYSASRCRGYLHAKSLGTGGEYLSYVWLLLSHMGMETLADRFQKPESTEYEEGEGAGEAAAGASSQSQVREAAAGASTSQSQGRDPTPEIIEV